MSVHLLQTNALFLHIPKTGGTWIEQALNVAAIENEYAKAIETVTWRHSLMSQYTAKHDFIFTFVRHPLSWYESWWKFQTWLDWVEHEPGVWHPQRILKPCAANDFSEFIRLCIKHEPAYVSRMYEWYIGPQGAEFVNFIGYFERLVEDLVRVLKLLCIDFDETLLRNQPSANVSGKPYGEPVWDEELKAQILALEVPAIRRFYNDEQLVVY
ncbi:MAG: sulfotransferase family 2 domain-containing protein [Acidobacteria bacterium]|nr:sulfotransferase family 2 domain-containing protein [Acidobacteriota bacterium]